MKIDYWFRSMTMMSVGGEKGLSVGWTFFKIVLSVWRNLWEVRVGGTVGDRKRGHDVTWQELKIRSVHCNVLHCTAVYSDRLQTTVVILLLPEIYLSARMGILATFLVTLLSALIPIRCGDLGGNLLQLCVACWPDTALSSFLTWNSSLLLADLIQKWAASYGDTVPY